MPTLSLMDGMRAVRLKLWDERTGRMVGFAQARAPRAERERGQRRRPLASPAPAASGGEPARREPGCVPGD